MPQSSELADQTANQKEATMTERTKVAGNTKDAGRPQSAMRNLKQKIKEWQTKNNNAKRREHEKVDKDNKQLETIESEEEEEEEEEEEDEIKPKRSESEKKTETEQQK